MKTTTEIHKFKKGQRVALDDIYEIQGLGGGDWWDHDNGEDSDDIHVTRDITIKITVIR